VTVSGNALNMADKVTFIHAVDGHQQAQMHCHMRNCEF
jgi:hypothetical protein